MDKTAIKNFAIWARNRLIESVSDRAGLMGITAQGIADPLPQSTGDAEFYDYGAVEPYMIAGDTIRQRQELVDAMRCKENETDYATAYQYIMEEVAYTWFNRLIAIRFMEVNDYLPSHLRVLSSESGKVEPDLVDTPFDSDLEFTEREKDDILLLKRNNKLDDLFRMLFIKQCNALNALLPGLFERTNDYTEVLLNISLIDQDGVIHHLVHDIPEDDFNIERGGQVEIIGWFYQYYNTEPKAAVFGRPSGTKIKTEDIPAATQLFTPDWIVRYMVQNSLGRLWVEGHPEAKTLFIPTEAERQAYTEGARDPEDSKWYYYLEEAEQEPEVEAQLAEIRAERAKLRPEDIRLIEPCMGSGHILVYAFEVLMQIYESVGYGQREAAQSILTHNLYGLDIDNRAYQLAYFSVMMKARQYDRRIFGRSTLPRLHAIEDSRGITSALMHDMGLEITNEEYEEAVQQTMRLVDEMQNAKDQGSLMQITPCDWALLRRFAVPRHEGRQLQLDIHGETIAAERLQKLINIAEILTQKYDVVVTNPPYMGSSNMNAKLSAFVKKNYPDSKGDLFACFIEQGNTMLVPNGLNCMVTMQSWMFLSSFEKMRARVLESYDIINLMHMDNMVLGIAFGTAVTIFKNSYIEKYKGTYNYIKLQDIENGCPKEFPIKGNRFAQVSSANFSKIPGSPVAYWVSDAMYNAFSKNKLEALTISDGQTKTGDNDRFLRFHWEIAKSHVGKGKHYRFYAKGGDFRKWMGNLNYVIDWSPEARNHYKKDKIARLIPKYLWYKDGITWTLLSSGNTSFRFLPNSATFDVTGSSLFFKDEKKILNVLALLNAKITTDFLSILSSTLAYQITEIRRVPVDDRIFNDKISRLTEWCIDYSKSDWNSFETSWDFQQDPLVRYSRDLWDATGIGATVSFYYDGAYQPFNSPMELAYLLWKGECNHRFRELKKNEEDMNRIFIDIYGLQDELTPDVADKDVTVYCVVDTKEEVPESLKGSNYVLTKRDVVVNFISYAVGCIFGRYSLNREGLVFAGGDFDSIYWKHKGHAPLNENGEVEPGGNYAGISLAKNHYSRFKDAETWEEATVLNYEPDADNIIPICDENYFEDDITGRFIKFVEVVFGKEDLTANLQFIADALGGKGSARDIIRKYFLKDFFADHCKRYQNRPIYWLFDSGKQNGFKALVYLHRYNPDTIGMLRVDYLHRMQKIYESEIERMQENINADYEVAKSEKRKEKMLKQLKETRDYDEKISHLALARTALDLDDGVKVNYRKLQTAADGQFYEVLANSKKIIGKEKKKK